MFEGQRFPHIEAQTDIKDERPSATGSVAEQAQPLLTLDEVQDVIDRHNAERGISPKQSEMIQTRSSRLSGLLRQFPTMKTLVMGAVALAGIGVSGELSRVEAQSVQNAKQMKVETHSEVYAAEEIVHFLKSQEEKTTSDSALQKTARVLAETYLQNVPRDRQQKAYDDLLQAAEKLKVSGPTYAGFMLSGTRFGLLPTRSPK